MKHFKNISSLSELKKKYKALAIANHPDRGGDTAIMQEINAEFDAMFAVLKNRPDIPKTTEEQKETGSAYRRHFYTANGWEGCRYDGSLRITEISARVKVYAKERYPEYKFSVRTEYYSGGASIHLRLVSGPVPAITADSTRDYISTMGSIDNYPGISDEVRAVVADVVAYANSFNYDDSDSMTDYFDVNFYLHIYIGAFGKPYQVVNPKAKKVSGRSSERKAEATKEPAQETSTITEGKSTAAVFMVEYSEKAVAVLGDTKAIKDDLKQMGGRFSGSLTVAGERVAGWIFSKAKETELTEYIKKLDEVPEELPREASPEQEAQKEEEKTYQNLYPLKDSAYKIFRHLTEAAHADEDQATKIDNGGAFMAVCVEVIRNISPDEELVSIAHYGEQNGDAMRDPEMTFYHNRKTGRAYAMTFRNDYLGSVETSILEDTKGRPKQVNRRRQRHHTDFAEQWLRNIKHQQTLNI